jgi:lipid-binding SYLF domain-containing protein
VLRKSKRHVIKLSLLALAAVTAAGAAAAVRPGAGVVRIAIDTALDSGAQHATAVEPDAAVNGSTVVSVFQLGRFFDGGAVRIGFAVSQDAGRTWRSGVLPSLTTAGTPPGPFARASDPVVVWDELHARWLASTLAFDREGSAISISTSPDGSTWSAPTTAVVAPAGGGDEGTNLDKEWLACDNGRASPFFGRCYLVYTDFRRNGLGFQSSGDGGVTWTAPITIRVRGEVPGPQLAVRPSGEVVLVMLGAERVEAIRSTDGGATFSAPQTISTLRVRDHPFVRSHLRVFPLPSADADAAGTVYAVWFDCRFRPGCRADDAVLARSTGGSWTKPVRIPLVARTSRVDVVLPSLGVDPAARGRLTLTYYTLAPAGCAPSACRLSAWQASSRTGGSRWTTPRRLNVTPMRLAWLPQTSTGRMVGDYFGAAFTGGRAVSVAALARRPRGGKLDQAMHALSAGTG